MIYFIRHAESQWNVFQSQIEQQLGDLYYDNEEYLSAKFSIKYLDVGITKKGVQQSLRAKEKIRDQEIDAVIVSPLRRALETCAIIFEEHPSKPPIFVQPDFRQIMESSCDIGSAAFAMQNYPFNFDRIKDPNAWLVSTLRQDDKQRVLKLIQGLEGQARKEKVFGQCLKIEKENYVDRRKYFENEEKIKQRVLPNIMTQRNVIRQYLKKYNKIAIVAHGECIRKLYGVKIGNCEIESLNANNL